jgi:type II secretory pathway component PulF
MPTNFTYDLVAQNPHSTVVAEYQAEYGTKKNRAEHYQSEAELEQAFIKQLQAQAYEYIRVRGEWGQVFHRDSFVTMKDLTRERPNRAIYREALSTPNSCI